MYAVKDFYANGYSRLVSRVREEFGLLSDLMDGRAVRVSGIGASP